MVKRTLAFAFALAVPIGALVAGCSDEHLHVAPYAINSGTIFPSGGRVAFSGGPIDHASIFIPLGALAAPQTITMAPIGSNIAPGCFTPAGPAVSILPGIALATSATIALPFATDRIAGGHTTDDIVIVFQNPNTGAYSVLDNTGAAPGGFYGSRLVYTESALLGFFQPAVATGGGPTVSGTTSAGGGTPPVINTAGGTVVSIQGANLFNGATVLFDADAATTVVEDQASTVLIVTAPPHAAGIVDVTITNVDGQTVTFPAAFEYTDTAP